MQPTEKPRESWDKFASLKSETAVNGEAKQIDPGDLVDMEMYPYRQRERVIDGKDVLDVFVAYAQNDHVFDENGRPVPAKNSDTYQATDRINKTNKFGKAYKDDAKLWLHKNIADIVIDAAIFMYKKHQWRSMLCDGLRTVNGAYNMYRNAAQSDLDEGLLAAPGLSAHNKGMAADLVQFDKNGKLVEMGGNFDHLDMKTNSRNNMKLAPEIIENRRKREIAFQHAALSQGKLFAPLRSEFWDERFPENETDHWRVLESLCRCTGKQLLTEEDERLKASKDPAEREIFRKKWEAMDYEQFAQKWRALFTEEELRKTLDLPKEQYPNLQFPPAYETARYSYHGDFHPLYDRDLPKEKQITDNVLDRTLPGQGVAVTAAR